MIAALLCTVLVHGTSMHPLLEAGKEYEFEGVRDTTTVQVGDIVLLRASPKLQVKRVAAIDSLYRLDSPNGISRWAKREWLLAIRRKDVHHGR